MKIGIQLYSVREHMKEDPLATIRAVAAAGYRHLEVANHNAQIDPGVGFGVGAGEIRVLLDELGAKIFSAHIFPLYPTATKRILEYHQEIGTRYIVVPMDFYRDRDDVLRKAELLNEVGAQCRTYGLQLLYHNHYHEFQHFGRHTIFDTLMDETEPDLVGLELDTYWAMRSGNDPIEIMKRYGERIRLIHQKDYAKDYQGEMNLLASVEAESAFVDMVRFARDVEKESFTEIGNGIMNIQEIIDVANEVCRSEYLVLEQDYTSRDELESIRISGEQLRRYSGLDLLD